MKLQLLPLTSSWVTKVSVITYILVFLLLVRIHEVLPAFPSQKDAIKQGIDLDAAWSDLETITQVPHPYNSRANEVVRNYLLERVREVANRYPTVHISDDSISNISYVENKVTGIYVEGSNILVKVEGRNKSLPAVLFSAHFDSSALALGVTDDGMGTISLLSLIEHFAKDQPLRTALFNLNNGEEDGLCGSHTFFRHPWWKEADTFLNIEGAGSGGRPILFRASSAELVKAFRHTDRPHGTITSSDAFSLGLVRSMTDFEVYAGRGGMNGLDVSFYFNRDKYHTMDDNIANLGSRAPFWTILKLTRDVGSHLTNTEHHEEKQRPVYWDVLGRFMVVFGMDGLVWLLPCTLVATVVVTLGMGSYVWYMGEQPSPSRQWIHFPLCLTFSILCSSFFVTILCKINPLIIYSSPYPVIMAIMAVIITSLLFPLHIIANKHGDDPSRIKTILSTQYFLFTGVLVLGYIQMLKRLGFGGFYFLEILHVGAALAIILDLGDRSWSAYCSSTIIRSHSEEPDESTQPLLEIHSNPIRGSESDRESVNTPRPRNLWLLEFLISVIPLSVLVLQLALIVSAALGQTIADGSSPVIVYAGLTALIFFSIVPMVPFAHLISRKVFFTVAFLFIALSAYNLVAFPFSDHKRVKFFYTQNLDLDTGVNHVQLLGVQPALRNALERIPSAKQVEANLTWSTDPVRGLGEAKWTSLSPRMSSKEAPYAWDDLVVSSAKRIDADVAIFTLRGKKTKSCVMRFDQNVIEVHVRRAGSDRDYTSIPIHDDNDMEVVPGSDYFMPPKGVPLVQLFSREWDTTFEVKVRWNTTAVDSEKQSLWRTFFARREKWPRQTGRIGCQWHENIEGRLPALDELFEHLPNWATLTVKRPLLTADRAFLV